LSSPDDNKIQLKPMLPQTSFEQLPDGVTQ